MLAAWLKAHFTQVRFTVFVLCALPGVYLLSLLWFSRMSVNPLETLTRVSGRTSLVMLALTLCVTPLRRLLQHLSRLTNRRYGKRIADWNWLVRLRRMLGLWCFAYALAHLGVYLGLDLGDDWPLLWQELREKPFMLAGAAALAGLVPLAATSPPGMMRRLGRHWLRLHRLTYLVALLALLHFWWLVKPGSLRALPDTVVLLGLLGYRLALGLRLLQRWAGDDGLEAPDRARAMPNTNNVPGPL